MSRVRIRINVLGQMPRGFDPQALMKWESSIFQIDHMETFQLYEDAAGPQWEFTDEQLAKHFRGFRQEHILVVLVSVRLQCNWYLRRMTNDRIVFTFHETAEILRSHDVPLANIVLRVLYAAALIYLRYENRIPPASEPTDYAHDETRGCLFDMNAYKSDIIHSCHRPRMCAYCVSQWQRAQVSNETIASVQREIKGIRKPLSCTIAQFVRRHPLWSLSISVLTTFIINVVSTIVGELLF